VVYLVILLYLAIATGVFVVLVANYGAWKVISTPIYPVKMKGDFLLSNGDVLSNTQSFVTFVLTLILWSLYIRSSQRLFGWFNRDLYSGEK
jgi:hypothetical protein